MARAKREEVAVRGLYKNGSRWWVRTVRSPATEVSKPLSTGTSDTARANRIVAMLDELTESRPQWEWLALAVAGDVTLDSLYNHYTAGTLHELREKRATARAAAADADLRPWVDKWVTEHLATLDIAEESKATYERQVRRLVTPETAFPKSQFNEDVLKARLAELGGARHDRSAKLSSSAKRRHVVAWQLFFKYARRRVPLTLNPFEDADWVPKNGSPRSTFYEHDKVKAILDRMAGEDRVAMALVFGSGIELGALLNLKRSHIGTTLDDGRGTIVAPGSKNEHREDRTIFVDKWAWEIVEPYCHDFLPRATLWTYHPANGGKELRDAFYRAQVVVGYIESPPASETTGKLLWGRSKPHTIHDARHSYCINRSLGLDGEEAQDAAFCANQLGHADETMVLKIYKKANVKERLRLIQQQQFKKAAVKAAGGQQ